MNNNYGIFLDNDKKQQELVLTNGDVRICFYQKQQ
jgi:hypothetical protein